MIDHRLVAVALEHVDTSNFERFAQAFYGAIQDREFVPLGGVHDGGAEGYDSPEDPEIFFDEAATAFLQVSKQQTTAKKIRATVARLREYGRNPKVLTYITSQTVSDIDKVEKKLSADLECRIAIRDAKFIEAYVNHSGATEAAFNSYLMPCVSFLLSPGVSELAKRDVGSVDRTLAVFLRQEVESRGSNHSLLHSISDGLIIWALRETDPENGVFLDRDQIVNGIETALPTAKAFIRAEVDKRLEALSAKDAPNGRLIRAYRKSGQYCLPYETRQVVAVENADDDLLKLRVSCAFEDRLAAKSNEDIDSFRSVIVDCCHATLERVFEKQGLAIANFVVNADVDDDTFTDVAELATRVVDEGNLHPEIRASVRRHVLTVLRGTFYMSTEVERQYLGKLSRTYVLLLLLKNEPRIVEFFGSMAGSFRLYIGSDLIVRALSELFLDEESQSTINLFAILKKAGSKLILTEKAVEEVATHIRRQMFEFENVYERNEHRVTSNMIEYIDRLLIRAYFYAKLVPVKGVSPPSSWIDYLNRFCSPASTRRNSGDRELAAFLMKKLGLEYEDTEATLRGLDPERIALLTDAIKAAKERGSFSKDNDILAYNDALQVLRVYAARREGKEGNPGNPFGYRTWWLTQDSKVRRASLEVVRENGGRTFMMRPEYLLNYIGLSPKMAEVRNSYRTIFPSALGVRLASGIGDAQFRKVMRDAANVAAVDDARAEAMIAEMSSHLQSDANKRFDVKW